MSTVTTTSSLQPPTASSSSASASTSVPTTTTSGPVLTERERELRQQRLYEWKLKITSSYPTTFLTMNITKPFETIYVKDSKEKREEKLKRNNELLEQIEQEFYQRREESVRELERLTEKVKETIKETGDVNEHYGLGRAIQIEEKLRCIRCGNKVS